MIVLNTFNAGDTITASGHNQNNTDIASEITNSLALDGQSVMTNQLKLANGTVSAPALTFGVDLNSGIYRIGADNIGVGVNGAKVLDIATTGLSVTGTLDFTGDFAVGADKLTVAASSGDTVVAGTLDVTGDVAINTDKLTVTASSGNTAIAGTLGVTGDFAVNTSKFTVAASSGNVVTAGSLKFASLDSSNLASQSDQETGTSTIALVTPSQQQSHKSAAKLWLICDSNGVITESGSEGHYNVTSIADTGAGLVTVTVATDFGTANYVINVTTQSGGATCGLIDNSTAPSTGSFRALSITTSTGSGTDPARYHIAAFGDQ